MFKKILFTVLFVAQQSFAHTCQTHDHPTKITTCTIDLRQEHLSLWLDDSQKIAYKKFSSLQQSLRNQKQNLVFAMNGGMFHNDFSPVGWFVSQQIERQKINTSQGQGNFFLKPNGIFLIRNNQAQVIDTQKYLSSPYPLKEIQLATQSGPMLVIDNKIHPTFNPQSSSKYIRNGVCTPKPWLVTFAISEAPINFYDFAQFFQKQLSCINALYLDGTISSLFDAHTQRKDEKYPLGPIIGIAKP